MYTSFFSRVKGVHLLIAALTVISLQSCIRDDDDRAYVTLRRNGPWKVESLKLMRYDSATQTIVVWDTTFYNHGRLEFFKGSGGKGDFSSDWHFPDGSDKVGIINSVNGEQGEDLYLSMIPQMGMAQVAHGGGYLDEKKGKELRIKSVKGYWQPGIYTGAHYPYAPTITREGTYSCDWHLVAEN